MPNFAAVSFIAQRKERSPTQIVLMKIQGFKARPMPNFSKPFVPLPQRKERSLSQRKISCSEWCAVIASIDGSKWSGNLKIQHVAPVS